MNGCVHRRMKLPVAMFQSCGSCAALVPSSTCHEPVIADVRIACIAVSVMVGFM